MNGYQPTNGPRPGPGSDRDGETHARFHANVARILHAVEYEPESTAAELAEYLDLDPDAVDRAILHLIGICRIRVTTGRHHIQTYAIAPDRI